MNLKWTDEQIALMNQVVEIIQKPETPSLLEILVYLEMNAGSELSASEIAENIAMTVEDDIGWMTGVIEANR